LEAKMETTNASKSARPKKSTHQRQKEYWDKQIAECREFEKAVWKVLHRLDLTGDACRDIIANHPEHQRLIYPSIVFVSLKKLSEAAACLVSARGHLYESITFCQKIVAEDCKERRLSAGAGGQP